MEASSSTESSNPATSRSERRRPRLVAILLYLQFNSPQALNSRSIQAWKSVYLVLRPSALSIYKSDKENNLRHKLYTSELSAVTLLKDPKNKRHNLFGLFSPARNYHFEAQSSKDAQEWVDLLRKDARIEEEEEEMFLASLLCAADFRSTKHVAEWIRSKGKYATG